MNWRILGFFLAAAVVIGRIVFRWRKGPPAAPVISEPESWSWRQLALASFLTLFAELALIRWLGTEVRVFAYVKNLALLVAFLGFGLGCALARRAIRWWPAVTSLLGLVMVVRRPGMPGKPSKCFRKPWEGRRMLKFGQPTRPEIGLVLWWLRPLPAFFYY